MNTARFAAALAAEANQAFERDLEWEIAVEADRAAFIESFVADRMAEASAELAHERDAFGYPEDTASVQSCDFWGTGEGQYHGVLS